MLAAFDRDQRVALLLGGMLVDDHAPYAVALMYRSWPPVNAGEHHAVQSRIGEISVALIIRDGSPIPFDELGILKRELFFRNQSDITPNDEDAIALKENSPEE